MERGIDVPRCASRAASRVAERIRALVKDPASSPSTARRGAALRGRAGAARRRARGAGASAAALGAARPLRRLLARLPGGRARTRHAGGRRAQRVRDRRARSPTARCCSRSTPAAGRARRGGRAARPDRLEREPDAFFEAINAAYLALADAEPQRIRVLDASRAPERCSRTRSPSSTTCWRGTRAAPRCRMLIAVALLVLGALALRPRRCSRASSAPSRSGSPSRVMRFGEAATAPAAVLREFGDWLRLGR